MKKEITALFLTCISFCSYAQSDVKSGLLLSGGIGSIKSELSSTVPNSILHTDVSYKMGFSIGYRFRLQPHVSSRITYDLDANVGLRNWKSSYRRNFNEPEIYSASSQYYYLSATATVNYSIYKGFKVGAGIEPTYYFKQNGESSSKSFDIPLVARIGYDFGGFEVGVKYMHGLFNVVDTKYLESGKFRDWQLSVFIPF